MSDGTRRLKNKHHKVRSDSNAGTPSGSRAGSPAPGGRPAPPTRPGSTAPIPMPTEADIRSRIIASMPNGMDVARFITSVPHPKERKSEFIRLTLSIARKHTKPNDVAAFLRAVLHPKKRRKEFIALTLKVARKHTKSNGEVVIVLNDYVPPMVSKDRSQMPNTGVNATPSLIPDPTLSPSTFATPTSIPTVTPTPTPSPSPIPEPKLSTEAEIIALLTLAGPEGLSTRELVAKAFVRDDEFWKLWTKHAATYRMLDGDLVPVLKSVVPMPTVTDLVNIILSYMPKGCLVTEFRVRLRCPEGRKREYDALVDKYARKTTGQYGVSVLVLRDWVRLYVIPTLLPQYQHQVLDSADVHEEVSEQITVADLHDREEVDTRLAVPQHGIIPAVLRQHNLGSEHADAAITSYMDVGAVVVDIIGQPPESSSSSSSSLPGSAHLCGGQADEEDKPRSRKRKRESSNDESDLPREAQDLLADTE
ncbi:hypothetical protein LTR66_016977 [Elasticomyces elasticus]|nr:hypothetical protein LTR66_016977 [Elasticomyces elasticus]